MEHFRTFYLTGIRHKHQFPFPWSRAQSRWRQTIFLETFPRSLFLGFRSFVPGLNGFYFSFYQKGNEGSLAGLHRSCNNCNSQSHLLPPLQTLSQIRSRLNTVARLGGGPVGNILFYPFWFSLFEIQRLLDCSRSRAIIVIRVWSEACHCRGISCSVRVFCNFIF